MKLDAVENKAKPSEMPHSAAMPRHVAIIMDGNGRWAAERGLPRALGHRSGVEAVRRTVKAAIELSIPYLTLYSFSSENWSRPKDEIDDLMGLMKRFIRRDLAELHQNNVCVKVIGERETIDAEMRALIEETCELTRGNTGLTLVIAFNDGARAEITRAARRLAEEVAAGRLLPSELSAEHMASALDTGGLPDPDVLIRTSGERRLSNFLLWQCAYTEFVFVDAFWPDFSKEILAAAIAEFQTRERRFGGVRARYSA
jgi:undecaprenyl diphosphate synthase